MGCLFVSLCRRLMIFQDSHTVNENNNSSSTGHYRQAGNQREMMQMTQAGTMRIVVKGKNIEVTDALRQHAEKKVGKLSKFFRNGVVGADVLLSVERELHIAEITLQVGGLLLRGESRTVDMYGSIDAAADRIERQLGKYKAKIQRRLPEGPRMVMAEANGKRNDDFVEDDGVPAVVRVKRFAIKPMDVEEAITQMELLGHDFFMFTNARTEQVNVVYKRRNGDYGLIEPTY